jgi:hypothetical protein
LCAFSAPSPTVGALSLSVISVQSFGLAIVRQTPSTIDCQVKHTDFPPPGLSVDIGRSADIEPRFARLASGKIRQRRLSAHSPQYRWRLDPDRIGAAEMIKGNRLP